MLPNNPHQNPDSKFCGDPPVATQIALGKITTSRKVMQNGHRKFVSFPMNSMMVMFHRYVELPELPEGTFFYIFKEYGCLNRPPKTNI